MDRRAEPRFSISSPIIVTLLSDLDRQINCRMTDISATGIRFVSEEAICEDEVVAVDFQDHLAVTRVRYCLPYGEKYTLGSARIYLLAKDELPEGELKYQHIRDLLDEKGLTIGLRLGEEEPTTPPEPADVEAKPAAVAKPRKRNRARKLPQNPAPSPLSPSRLQSPNTR